MKKRIDLYKATENIMNIVHEGAKKYKIDYDFLGVKILTDMRTVGVQGDHRTFLYPLVISLSKNGKFVYNRNFMSEISSRITNEITCVNHVTYDITNEINIQNPFFKNES
jgi:GMP synthase (glutamine-hydrolysing)